MKFRRLYFFDTRRAEGGYFTVEAALILPMALLFSVMMIFLAFYSYDRCVLEQSAYEAALRGTSNHIKSADEAYSEVYSAADRLARGKLFALHDFSYDVSVSADFVTVKYHCVVNMPLMSWLSGYVTGVDMTLNVEKAARRSAPTKFIRSMKSVSKVISP